MDERLERVLRAARCPDGNCDQHGTTFDVVRGRDGEPEQSPAPCEWCHDRAELLGDPSLLQRASKPITEGDIKDEIPF